MKKKKYIAAFLFSVGLISTLSTSANAYSVQGTCNKVGCEAQLNMRDIRFTAGTYSYQDMADISVELNGKGELWGRTKESTRDSSVTVRVDIETADAWSKHHADNDRGDDFDRCLRFKDGRFYRTF